MAKRLAIAFFVVLGVCILVLSGFLLVLFLAPGFSAFGIKYIAKDTHPIFYEDIRIVDASEIGGSFNGSVIINTNEIPIEICFSSTGNTQNQIRYTYKDNFNGITNSSFDDPSFEITKDQNGNAVITTHEFQKFLYESSTSERLLKIYLPARFVADSATNFVINSKNSPVTFYLEDSEDANFVPRFQNLTVNTSGKISINHKILADTFTSKSNSSIEIGVDEKTNINANNYVLESLNGRINIKRPVAGDIQAKTTNGEIKFVSCKNLVASTSGGSILSSTSEEIVVNGLVNITTKSGSVTIGKILGVANSEESANNKITTSSGNVTINRIVDGEITTSRGSVSLKNSNNVKIITNMGNVSVEEALTALDINTVRGNVKIGGNGITMNNPTVFSRTGKVFVYSASGKANVQTISSNISFVNANCSETKIVCGGKIVAENLSGKVEISAQKNIDITFNIIDQDTTITLADTVTQAKVTAIKNTAKDTRFILKGKSVTRYELGANGTYSKVSTDSETSNEPTVTGPLLSIGGSVNANIEVYFNS